MDTRCVWKMRLPVMFVNRSIITAFQGSGNRGRQPHHLSGPEEPRRFQDLCVFGRGQAQQGGCLSQTHTHTHIKSQLVFLPGNEMSFFFFSFLQIVTSASIDLQDYTYYFVAAPWLSVKLLRLLQCYPPPGTAHYISVSRLRLDSHLFHSKRKVLYRFSSPALPQT